ncbi:hydrolase [Niastella yeongjuensis]|uniref:Hydrolase n=1 Tax=Niastella yeongjuensis TaxID=354355 RepID=A0A1V9EA54_9BACT|nr:hydrolase [Niastella yeongjuensis]OQP42979.1 hydrolase [Niastella yeongjuensis]SEO61719.1 Nicotinamidase-related amidase [Niastella yeongjuensis]
MTISDRLLTPTNHQLVLIDFEGLMAFSVGSMDVGALRTNSAVIAGASKIFKVPTTVTTVAEKTISGPVFPDIMEFYPETANYLDRTNMNTWEDKAAYKAITSIGRKKIVMAGMWTSVCIVGPVLCAIAEGYEVYVVADACADVSVEAHENAMQRMIQAGAQPITSVQYLLELQRDWASMETYDAVVGLMQRLGGAYGIGIQYAYAMLKH